MGNRLRLSGFRELRDELATLPDAARDRAAPIEADHARRAQAAVIAEYPHVTGALRAGVHIVARHTRSPVAVLYTLTTSAPHAHLYEFGTVHTRPHAVFLPITERERRASVVAVSRMVESLGLKVSGARD